MLTFANNDDRPQVRPENASKTGSAARVVLGIALAAVVVVAGLGALYRLSARRLAPVQRGDAVELRVSRDFGATAMTERLVAAPPSSTVMALVAAHAKLTTAYGGGFVDAIDGVSSGYTKGGSVRADWFYYVNGLQATVGAADYHLGPHDRVWWDFHAWDFAPSVPAVIGPYPEPFLSGAGGRTLPTRIAYTPSSAADAGQVESALRSAGVARLSSSPLAESQSPPQSENLVLVGTWTDLSRLVWVREAAENPAGSGIFARYEDGSLLTMDVRGRAVRLSARAGAIMATARADAPDAAIWLVTGSDPSGVSAAASLLASRPDQIAGKFGVLVGPSDAVTSLPIGGSR
jgi:Domain of unknown function (DUF4430)